MNVMTIMLQAAGGGSAQFLIMMVLIFGVMYFLMIRPQQKKQKELVKFRNALEKGQKIVTAGGIYGTVKEVKEGYVLVEVDSNVAIRVDKNMVMRDPSDSPVDVLRNFKSLHEKIPGSTEPGIFVWITSGSLRSPFLFHRSVRIPVGLRRRSEASGSTSAGAGKSVVAARMPGG